ncbi:hypothetical protein EVAR_7438_1 [Eumeta japonica]|uniref:Uncharacterized protein n=1 Tax=Eumeta variegata TaxID=151549 RepID=A0A4C1V9K1_EUMVA|nr:hypothetical protein EVAR_7438_1 [Eumeta japonica]
MYVLEWSARGAAGTHQEQTEKIIDLPGLAILAPPKVYALCLGTGGTAPFTALCLTLLTTWRLHRARQKAHGNGGGARPSGVTLQRYLNLFVRHHRVKAPAAHASAPWRLNLHACKYPIAGEDPRGAEALLCSAARGQVQFYSSGRSPVSYSTIAKYSEVNKDITYSIGIRAECGREGESWRLVATPTAGVQASGHHLPRHCFSYSLTSDRPVRGLSPPRRSRADWGLPTTVFIDATTTYVQSNVSSSTHKAPDTTKLSRTEGRAVSDPPPPPSRPAKAPTQRRLLSPAPRRKCI